MALVVFDPYLSFAASGRSVKSRAARQSDSGRSVLYVFFGGFYAEAYHGERLLLLNGRVNNLEYGSYAPNAPQDVFIDDAGFRERWLSPDRYYICIERSQVARLRAIVGLETLHLVTESGGKFVFTNK